MNTKYLVRKTVGTYDGRESKRYLIRMNDWTDDRKSATKYDRPTALYAADYFAALPIHLDNGQAYIHYKAVKARYYHPRKFTTFCCCCGDKIRAFKPMQGNGDTYVCKACVRR